jgi:hypothetical protein
MKNTNSSNPPRNHRDIPAPKGTLGTFAGVFTPSVLTILGIILFLRLGFVVGNAGLGPALLILLLANGISVLTSVSFGHRHQPEGEGRGGLLPDIPHPGP